MKILNLFAGIGGNRTLWGDKHEITAVEFDEKIAVKYKELFPNDIIVVGDAYTYFLEHFKEYDLLWASPPCQSHSRLVRTNIAQDQGIKYPDLRLYELILFCKAFFRGIYIIENVKPYYKPLIRPTSEVGRHILWSNVIIPNKKFPADFTNTNGGTGSKPIYIKNKMNPKAAQYILSCVLKPTQMRL